MALGSVLYPMWPSHRREWWEWTITIMKPAELNHIVFHTSKIPETANFWENVLGLENNITHNENLLQYICGKFLVMFSHSEKAPKDFSQAIGHLGIEFPSKKNVDEQYERLKKKLDIPKPIGGWGKGPYRFYIKDPNGISIEFETWEGCSD